MWMPPTPSRSAQAGRVSSSSNSSAGPADGSSDSVRNPRESDSSSAGGTGSRQPRPSNGNNANDIGSPSTGLRWLGRLATVATSAAKEFGMTDEEISSVKDTLSTSSTQLRRALSAGPQGVFSDETLPKPTSDSAVNMRNSEESIRGTSAAPTAFAPGPISDDSDFPADMAKAVEDALTTKKSKPEDKVLSNTGLTGADDEWDAAHLLHLRKEFKECIRLIITVKESVAEQLHESQSYNNLFMATRIPTMRKFGKMMNVYCEKVVSLEVKAYRLVAAASQFDLSATERGNGYRSLLKILFKSLGECSKRLQEFLTKRNRVLGYNMDDAWLFFIDYVYILDMLAEILDIAATLYLRGECVNLFVDGLFEQLVAAARELPTSHFYGRRFGFQYPQALAQTFKIILSALASFGEAQKSFDNELLQQAGSLLMSGKYMFDAHQRGKNLSASYDNTDVEFIKKFWNFTDSPVAKHASKLLAPLVAVNRVLQLPIEELSVPGNAPDITKLITAPDPEFPYAFTTVQVRLISFAWRQGQVFQDVHVKRYDSYTQAHDGRWERGYSKGLIVHIHGGGFVAQSSQSHEVYLRMWAKQTGVPIVSIDYSLSPEAKYPKAVQECFYAYCWALAHASKFGSTGEQVIICGDSAGGNLSVAVALLSVMNGVRKPDAIMPIYGALNICKTASPSRLMSVMDPLLPYGVLLTCMEAYTTPEAIDKYDPILSPLMATDDLLKELCPVYLAAAELDPILDDTVMFGTRLRRLGVGPVKYHVFEDLPHGFLNLAGHNIDCSVAAEFLGKWLCEMFDVKPAPL